MVGDGVTDLESCPPAVSKCFFFLFFFLCTCSSFSSHALYILGFFHRFWRQCSQAESEGTSAVVCLQLSRTNRCAVV